MTPQSSPVRTARYPMRINDGKLQQTLLAEASVASESRYGVAIYNTTGWWVIKFRKYQPSVIIKYGIVEFSNLY